MKRERLALMLTGLLLAGSVHAFDYTYTTNSDNTITITKYTGTNAVVIIPDTINGLPVTDVGSPTFSGNTRMTSVTIPSSVTNIGFTTFSYCSGLKTITVVSSNSVYSSVGGVLFDISQTGLIQCPVAITGSYTIPNSVTNIGLMALAYCTGLTSVTIPNSVTSIGNNAFFRCTNLLSITIPGSVTIIENGAFENCTNLTRVYSTGNAPSANSSVFTNDNNATVYYLPGTTGWSTSFGGRPTVCWNPTAQNLGVQSNHFGFNITGSSNLVIVVEACTNLANPVWTALGTNTLTGGASTFTDPESSNYPSRFYRFRPL